MLAVLCTLGRHICAPLGSAQLQIVWRLIGWAMLLSVIRAHPPGIDPGIIAGPYHAIAAAGLLLLILGARLALLIAAAAAWTWLQIYILRGHDSHYDFVADEHLLFALVPALAALAWIFAALEHRHADPATRADAVTRAQRWQLRLCTLATLAFSALHKLNSDFLAAKTSCATLLADRLAATWGLPDAPVGPLAIVAAEALVPVLQLLYPRLGALCLLALVTGLGHAGPYAFNALLAALALAFISPTSTASWRRYAARAWPALLLAALLVVGLASRMFTAERGYWPYALFELTLVLVVWLLIGARPEPRAWWRPTLPARPWLPGGLAQRSLCILAAIALALTGLSPYLGLKFRLSFAMLSNLRADDDRWNSLVIPRALSLRSSDPFVHVRAVRAEVPGGYRPARRDADALRPRTYSPQAFRRRHDAALRRWLPLIIELRYRGVDYQFTDLRFDRRLRELVASLPREPLFQDELSGSKPQTCVH